MLGDGMLHKNGVMWQLNQDHARALLEGRARELRRGREGAAHEDRRRRQQAEHVNPISLVRSTDAPVPDSRIGEYYPMFGLAVRYLLDEDGLGRSVLDVKELYLDMQTTVDFRDSFERVMGLSVEDYEDQFYELVAEILP